MSGAGGSSAAQGGSNQGGSELTGIGNGELDASCMSRTSIHTDGARIVLRNAVTAEGDQVFVGFYDNEKKVECAITQDAEGKYRCMPPAHDKDRVNRYFLDDKCTDEIEYRGICGLDYQAEPVSSDACDQRRRIFGFGERLPDLMVYASGTGECKPYNVLNNLYRRGPDLDPAEYAEVKPAVWRGAGRIWAQGYADDGELHIVNSFLDSQLNERCDFQLLADGKEHCVPQLQGHLQYTDSSCKQTLLTSSSTCGSALARYASYTSVAACSLGSSFVKADASFTDPRYIRSSCMPSMNPTGSAFTVKAAPDTDFLTVETKTQTTDAGRLKPMYRNAADGGCFFHDWWDEQLQTPCSFASNSAEAPYYCLPTSDPTSRATTLEAFSDSECKVAATYVQVPSCELNAPPKFAVSKVSSCVIGWRTIRTVDPTPVTLPALWSKSGSTCMPYTPDATATYYAASEPMPNSMFMQATLAP